MKCVKTINPFLFYSWNTAFPSLFLTLVRLGGWLEVEGGSTLKPVKKPRGRILGCGASAQAPGFSVVGRGRGVGSLLFQGAMAILRGGRALVSPVNKV